MSEPNSTPQRVGNWEGSADVSFALAKDELRNTFHIVYGEKNILHYLRSIDGGASWSDKVRLNEGQAPQIAVDSFGIVHLVYKLSVGSDQRIEYRTYQKNALSDSKIMSVSVGGQYAKYWAPKIAVDGGDNVHILYWSSGQEGERKDSWRTAYCYKPAGTSRFDPTELWRDYKNIGLSKYGTITLDEEGNAHLFWVSVSGGSHGIEHRVRYNNGDWGDHQRWASRLTADWSISAAIGRDGDVHISTQRKVDDDWKVIYLNNRDDPDTMAIKLDAGIETTETYTDLLMTSNGDLWMATGHREGPRVRPVTMPNIGAIYHFDASKATWGDKTNLSPAGYLNVSARQSGYPRLVQINDQVRLFYFEQAPGEGWKLWQRVISL